MSDRTFPTDDPEYAALYAEESAKIEASELIAAALESAGVSKTELARRLGVSKSEVSARLAGERNITVRSLAATLHALGQRLELTTARDAPSQLGSSVRAADWVQPVRPRMRTATRSWVPSVEAR